MKHTHCITCNKEKSKYGQYIALCRSCSHKGNTFSEESKKKMSEAHKGRTHSEESKKKMSDSKKARGLHLKYPGLKRWTRFIKQRDGECVHCHSKEKLEAHHLLPKVKFPQFATELWNGLTLCAPCHTITHSKVGI